MNTLSQETFEVSQSFKIVHQEMMHDKSTAESENTPISQR